MAEYGNPFGVDRLLDLSTMGQEYTNMRMGRANALRGLTKLGAVSAPNTQLAANLRGLGTATHKDITARLTDRMLGQRLDNEDQFRGRYKLLFGEDYNEFYDEVIKNWREQVRLGISQASEKRAKAGELRAAELHPGAVTTQQQAIAKEKARIKAEDIDEGMIAVVKRAAENDIQAIRDGKKYHAVVRDRLTKESAGWEKSHSDYYKSLMGMAGQKPDPTEIARIAKLALDDATQYVIDTTISGVEGGMSASGAYSNAVSSVRSGVVSGKYDDQEAVRRLKALGYNVVPLTEKEQIELERAGITLTKEKAALGWGAIIDTSKSSLLTQLKKGEISYDEAPEKLRSMLALHNIDENTIGNILTNFSKETEEFKPYNPALAQKIQRWEELATLGEKDQQTRKQDLLTLNAEVRDSVNSWFMKGVPGSIDEKSRESVVGAELWNIILQIPDKQQQIAWEFLKSLSPYKESMVTGAFGSAKAARERMIKAGLDRAQITVKDSKGEAKTIDVPVFPRETISKGEEDIPYNILNRDGKKARMKQLERELYPRYIIDQIIDYEVKQAES